MENKKAKQKRKNIIICLILSFILALMFLPISTTFSKNDYAFADSSYTTVLEDLSKDEAFNINDYPKLEKDYSLQVVQIAESKDRELFVYVYQPSGTLQASSINISTKTGDELDYINYTLVLLDTKDTLSKYKVRDFIVSTENIRKYDISSIYRPFNTKIDTQPDNGNTITEIAYSVSCKFYAKTLTNGFVEYASVFTDVVYITDKFCGFVRYTGGFELLGWSDSCDSHFIAFNTDRKIDRLLEADVYYTQQQWFHGLMGYPTYQYIDNVAPEEDKKAYLSYTQKGEFQGTGWWASTYTWNRISSVNEFISNEKREDIYECGIINVKKETKLQDAALEELKGKNWVLRFVETAYKEDGTTDSHFVTQQIVGNVATLRLKFETDNIVYNLGVVDNKVTGDVNPINETKVTIEPNIPDWLKTILYVLLVVILVGISIPFLPYIIHGLAIVLKYLFLCIWYVLKYTAIGIYWLFAWPFYLKKR